MGRLTKLIVDEYKSNAGCAECGELDPDVLVFHHLFNKEYNISDMVSSNMSIDSIMNEISKCIVLCHNCHNKAHRELEFDSSIKGVYFDS